MLVSIAEAARREKVGEQSISRWKAELNQALGEAAPSNRPKEVHLGLADPTTPTFQAKEILPTP